MAINEEANGLHRLLCMTDNMGAEKSDRNKRTEGPVICCEKWISQ